MSNQDLFFEFEEYASIIRVRDAINEAMVTPQDAVTWLEQIAKIAGLAKQAKDLADKADQIAISELITELREELVNVRNKWVDSQEEVLALSEENLALKLRIKELEDGADVFAGLTLQGSVYVDSDGNTFCGTCLNRDNVRQPIEKQRIPGGQQRYVCPIHKLI